MLLDLTSDSTCLVWQLHSLQPVAMGLTASLHSACQVVTAWGQGLIVRLCQVCCSVRLGFSRVEPSSATEN